MKRFFDKTKLAENGCFEWQAAKNPAGYGMFNRTGTTSKVILAHRMAYLLEHGELPEGSVVMHLCDNPSCVNVKHLRLGTHAENHDDKKNKGRSNTGTRHGMHVLNEEKVLGIRASKMRQRDIAAIYGITQSVVSEIRARKAWRHI